jgi:prepilin-type N-terminal cleavage/methylation domain-containing protein/prepilin-type processing-associated H-X9-DG protein
MKHRNIQKQWEKGFTLIELLTVIAIIAILAAILIPVVGSVREQARRAVCQSNLRQLANAGHLYAADHDDAFPAVGQIINPWRSGGEPPSGNPANLPLNSYVDNNYDVFKCPADLARHKAPNAPSWANQPFHESQGTSYMYNSYVTTIARVNAGQDGTGLAGLRVSQVTNPSRMVFFGDQDARVIEYAGGDWRRLTLWWHAEPNSRLKANIAFVDGSVRLVDIVSDPRPGTNEPPKLYSFYNE